MTLTVFLFLAILFKFLISTTQANDKSNYVLDYENLNYLVEYCKINNVSFLKREGFEIIQTEPYLISKKDNKTFTIKC